MKTDVGIKSNFSNRASMSCKVHQHKINLFVTIDDFKNTIKVHKTFFFKKKKKKTAIKELVLSG